MTVPHPPSPHAADDPVSHLAAIVASADDAIVSQSLDGVVASWNNAAERIFGFTAAEMIGQPIARIIPPYRLDEEAQIIRRVRRGERVSHFRTIRRHKSGKRIALSVTISPVLDADGRVVGASKIGRDISGTVELERRYEAIVQSSDDAIVSKDLQGVVRSWNDGAERLFGYTASEMIGRPITVLFPPDRVQEEPQILARLRRGERVDHFETVRMRKDGKPISVSVTISPVLDLDGEVIGASKIARDITERVRMERLVRETLEAERSARAEAEHASRMKDEFLATLSHELRTPLNAIVGWASMLSSGIVGGDRLQQGLDVIARNARAQTQIIDDLLDMSRIISGKVRLETQPIDVSAALRTAVDSVRPSYDAKGVLLDLDAEPCTHSAQGDPNRLQQVFWNLLTNALKFTPRDGTVSVSLTCEADQLRVVVADTGEGIPAAFLPHVFDRFRQADASTTRKHGGLGLGLAIVKQLVELHGGTVGVASPGRNRGATFTITLPLTPTAPTPTDRLGPTSSLDRFAEGESAIDLTGVTVLVVDDEPDARVLVQRLLEDHGATIHTAGSADEAIERVRTHRPNLIVSDIGMPGEDGYALLRRVRTLVGDAGDLPVVALTAYARSEDRVRSVLAGFSMHLSKPIEAAELLATVASLTRRK